MIERTINSIVFLFAKNKIIDKLDTIFYTNMILGHMGLEYKDNLKDESEDIAELFNKLGEYAEENLGSEKDCFIDYISGILQPAPSVVNNNFQINNNKRNAFRKFHRDAINSYYIKYDRLAKNLEWDVETEFGDIAMTVNLSKPEKTLKQIAAAKQQKDIAYPKCVLCKENIGFFGNSKRDSRQNIRFIQETLNGKKVFMHYSPYGYFDQHLIINNFEHVDMVIDGNTINQLLEFIEKFPFYFIGSNSDIPIVGGSILSHQHYQGGSGCFPVFHSKPIYEQMCNDVKIELLEWPLSTVKVSGNNKGDVSKEAIKVLENWYRYQNEELNIIKEKDGKRQNAVTPFARKNGKYFEIFLILRNNGTSKEFPEGIFHVKKDVWNIKKENIGIIEAAGKAILPGRLIKQFNSIAKALEEGKTKLPESAKIHQQWYKELKDLNPKNNYLEFVKQEAGKKFAKGLTDCGVFYKKDQKFIEFLEGFIYD